jgi:GR25 family glycosyltransferase involved in LPS biosynthesis
MVVIMYLRIFDIDSYRREFIECLIHNLNIPLISSIYIFCEKTYQNLPVTSRVKYLVKKNYSESDIINYVKRLEVNKDRFIWSNPFVKFSMDLIEIKNNRNIYRKKNDFLVFNRDTIIDYGLDSLIANDNLKTKTKIIINREILGKGNNRIIKKEHKEIIRKSELENKSKKSELDLILVSVDYNEYLEKVLFHNTKLFNNITVITHPDDIFCHSLCEKFNVNCITDDSLYKNGTINKSLGINKAIKSLTYPDWILIVDADIIINKKIDIENLNIRKLYTSSRYICDNMNNYYRWRNGEIDIKEIGKLEADRGIGFFQLFNYSQKKSYPDSNYGRYSESTWSDLIFKSEFKERETLNLDIIHLGKPYQKWKKIELDKIFETSVKVVEEQEVLEQKIVTEINEINLENNIDKLKISKRSEDIIPKLAVITTFFNPKNYINLKYNYLKFSEKIKEKADLFPIELSFNDDFFIQDKNVIRIKGNESNVLWQKEKLLNIALSKLPEEYTNIAWIDCDIIFENQNWVDEVNEKLKYYKVLQLYENAKRLDDNGDIERISEGAISRIARVNFVENVLYGIPGFAWAIRREVIDKVKFLETQIIGGADALMYYSFFGVDDSILHKKMNKEWFDIYMNWFSKSHLEINGSVSYIKGNILHLYHGKMINRNYENRYKILTENNFNPEEDLIEDVNNLWKFKDKELSKKMSKYFESRNEDDNIIEINNYFDNIYVLNLNRRADRFEKIKNKLDLLNIKFERFSAIDGDDISDDEYDFSKFIQGRGMLENKYALACLRSHIEIIKDAKSKGYERILIFEDDVLISKDINIHLQKLRKIKDWKLLYLGSTQYNWDVEFIEDFFLSKRSLGTFAYGIDYSIYDEILNQSVGKSVDNVISDIQGKYYGECYTFYPNICVSDVSESDIRSDRDQESHSKRMRWDILKNYL